MLAGSCVVPVVIWGSHPPSHHISSILYIPAFDVLVTGAQDGQLVLWAVSESNWQLQPHSILMGHTSAVQFLAFVSQDGERPYFISVTDTGEMCLWDLQDARSIEIRQSRELHKFVQAYRRSVKGDIVLICGGKYPYINVINPLSLEPLFLLHMNIQANWILSMISFFKKDTKQDVLLGVTNTGNVFIWTLTGDEEIKYTAHEKICEGEFKTIRCQNAHTLKCCSFNPRTLLLVTTKEWQIYDAVDMTLLCSESAPRLQRWIGGDFISLDTVVVYSNQGIGYFYKLPVNLLKGKVFEHMPCVTSGAIVTCSEFRSQGASSPQSDYVTRPFALSQLRVAASQSSGVAATEEHLLDTVSLEMLALTAGASPTFSLTFLDTSSGYALFRGDAQGRVCVWHVEVHCGASGSSDCGSRFLRQDSLQCLPNWAPQASASLQETWSRYQPTGLLDLLMSKSERQVTSTVLIKNQGKIALGLDSGEILVTSLTDCLANYFFREHEQHEDSAPIIGPTYLKLIGHRGRVNFLLYPCNGTTSQCNRYDASYLVSGGADFAVMLWCINSGTRLYRFVPHGGPLLAAYLPPSSCSTRLQHCIVSVAADNSVCLVNLKDRKPLLIASRHLFPVCGLAWRPQEDFLLVACVDGSLYVWQTEVAALDRVVYGSTAEDIWTAADHHEILKHSLYEGANGPGYGLASFGQVTSAAKILHKKRSHKNSSVNVGACPLKIKSLKLNASDSESHVILFDTELLIVNLLSDEQNRSATSRKASGNITTSSMPMRPPPPRPSITPGGSALTLTPASFQQHQQQQLSGLEGSPNTQRKIAGFMSKVKTGAENLSHKLQSKAETAGIRVSSLLKMSGDDTGELNSGPISGLRGEADQLLSLEAAQILVSLLHAWGLDPGLDRACRETLGLLPALRQLCFGAVSREGFISLMLPGWSDVLKKMKGSAPEIINNSVDISQYWRISSSLTTQHLLAVVSVAHCIMSMSLGSFRQWLLLRNRFSEDVTRPSISDLHHSAEIAAPKQVWSLLATLHVVLLPDILSDRGLTYKPPTLQLLAQKWQDRCLEIRQAAQALLLSELRRLGFNGRKVVVDRWAEFLPAFALSDKVSNVQSAHTLSISGQNASVAVSAASTAGSVSVNDMSPGNSSITGASACTFGSLGNEEIDGTHLIDEHSVEKRGLSTNETRCLQAVAIVILGVIGAEFGHEVASSTTTTAAANTVNRSFSVTSAPQCQNAAQEGFGLGDYHLARSTCRALTHLLLEPSSPGLPHFTPVRRAAVELLGRGFTVWEPYLDVSAVLLALLELCADAEKLLGPSENSCLSSTSSFSVDSTGSSSATRFVWQPLSPKADMCRTARHALGLIANCRPHAYLCTLAREVTRYNSLAANAHLAGAVAPHNAIVYRARRELLRTMEMLCEKHQNAVSELMVETTDIVIHCLDTASLREVGLREVFPPLCRFLSVSSHQKAQKICAGSRLGILAFYDTKAGKIHTLQAHKTAVSATSFSPDGKYLASYSMQDCSLKVWTISSTNIFGIGSNQVKLSRAHAVPPFGSVSNNVIDKEPHCQPLADNAARFLRLEWRDARHVIIVSQAGDHACIRI